MTYLIAYGFVSGANIPSNATTHAVHVAHIFIKPIRSIQEPRVLKCETPVKVSCWFAAALSLKENITANI